MKLVDAPYFTYRGGKARLRRFILRWCPLKGSTYFEPFAGRGNMFFLMKMINGYTRWCLNDNQMIPFFESIKAYKGETLPELRTKEDVLELRKTNINIYNILEPLVLWAGSTKNAGITGYRGHNLADYKNRVLLSKQLLHHTELYSLDAIELLDSLPLDSESFVYLDPPYLAGNVGIYRPDSFDRPRMIELLKNAKYKWALSEYECDDLNESFGNPIIKYHDIPIVSAIGKATTYRTEVLYTNYPVSQGPNRLNFGDSERPLTISRNIFQRYIIMTEKDFIDKCPRDWNITTKRAQFKRLTCIPEAYFDGRTLYNLNIIKYWPPV